MYRIVIAEDEEEVRKRIVKHINESDTEYRIIGEAGDGELAIELVRELKPDILLTDICMPNVNGLELIRGIREVDKELPIVVVSGYDEFSYAREAMSMGVREYLLKPFLPKELFEVLDKTKKIIEQKNQIAVNLQNMSIELQKNLTYSRERFFHSLLDGKLGKQETEVTAVDIGFDLEADWYCAGIVGFEASQQVGMNQMMALYMETIKEYYISKEISIHEARSEHGQLMLFFSRKGRSKEKFLQDIRIGMEKICLSMKQYHKITAKCAVGSTYDSYEKLNQSFQEALDTWRVLLYQDRAVTIYTRNTESREMIDEEKAAEMAEQLLLDIQMGDSRSAVARVSDIIDYYAALSPDMVEYISISLVKLVLKISDLMEKSEKQVQAWNDQKVISYLKRHFTYGSLSEAKEVLEEYIGRCCGRLNELNENNGDKIIRNAKMVIDQNLGNEEFNLDVLADTLHFSPNYVRQLLKEKTGENFSDYLFRRRMEMAAELLRNPNHKIQEVAEKTGYSNQRYFARCFKKYYNLTPTEYKEKNWK